MHGIFIRRFHSFLPQSLTVVRVASVELKELLGREAEVAGATPEPVSVADLVVPKTLLTREELVTNLTVEDLNLLEILVIVLVFTFMLSC